MPIWRYNKVVILLFGCFCEGQWCNLMMLVGGEYIVDFRYIISLYDNCCLILIFKNSSEFIFFFGGYEFVNKT